MAPCGQHSEKASPVAIERRLPPGSAREAIARGYEYLAMSRSSASKPRSKVGMSGPKLIRV